MNKRINITKANFLDSKLYLHASEPISGLSPAEQILVDSKEFSFVYLMENQEGYTYIDMKEPIWPLLKKVMEQSIPVWILSRDTQLELTNFYEELTELINNIRGNSNYGAEMVTKVEEIF
ncbi:hypothetical protein [Neobacillus niacini]|uniref:UPF0738 family protein n=1 Tax=Neobacillus niacini TaxID=86668 RepID=UPI00203BCFAE|nr:hypothetical protein [Neobacillus niacini]MCM3690197.1 hypothetical protein [Neobacillus niacini]